MTPPNPSPGPQLCSTRTQEGEPRLRTPRLIFSGFSCPEVLEPVGRTERTKGDQRGRAQELSESPGRWPTQGIGPQEPLGGGGDQGSKLGRGQGWERGELRGRVGF